MRPTHRHGDLWRSIVQPIKAANFLNSGMNNYDWFTLDRPMCKHFLNEIWNASRNINNYLLYLYTGQEN